MSSLLIGNKSERHKHLQQCYIVKHQCRTDAIMKEKEEVGANDVSKDEVEVSLMADLQQMQQQEAEKILEVIGQKVGQGHSQNRGASKQPDLQVNGLVVVKVILLFV